MVAFPAVRVAHRPRVLLREAFAKASPWPAQPGQAAQGPGGENGPYQTMHVPTGWVVSPEERQGVRSPEDACTQHEGNKPPFVLSGMHGEGGSG